MNTTISTHQGQNRRDGFVSPNKDYNTIKKKLNMLGASNEEKVLEEFKFKQYNISDTSFDAKAMAEELQRYMDGDTKSVFSYDIETLGGKDYKDTLITEFGLVEYQRNATGGFDKKRTMEIALGVDPTSAKNIEALIDKASKSTAGLSGDELSILQRLSLYSGDFNTIFTPNTDGTYRVNTHSASAPKDIGAVRSGLFNLKKLHQESGELSNKIYVNTVEEIADKTSVRANGILMGFNNNVFDDKILDLDLKRRGRKGLGNVRSLDVRKLITTTFDGRYGELHKKLSPDGNVGDIFSKGKGKLETFLETIGLGNILHHKAGDDAEGVMNLLTAKYGESGKELVEEIYKLQGTKSKANNIISNSDAGDKVLRTKKALRLGDFDVAMQIVDGGYQERSYGNIGAKRGHYYKINQYRSINPEDILKDIELMKSIREQQIDYDFSKPIFMMEIEDAADVINKEKIRMFRNSESEFQKMFQNNFEILKVGKKNQKGRSVTTKTINKNTAAYVADGARRAYQGGFEATGYDSFSQTRKLHEAYSSIYNVYGDSLSQEDIIKLLSGQDVRDIKSTEFKKLLSPLQTSRGNITNESLEKFAYSYGRVKDTNQVMSRVTQAIESSDLGSSRELKAIVLNQSYQEIMQQTKEALRSPDNLKNLAVAGRISKNLKLSDIESLYASIDEQFSNMAERDVLFGDGKVLQIKANGSIRNVQMGDPTSSIGSFLREIESSIPNYKNLTTAQKQAHVKQRNMEISKDLMKRGLLPEDFLSGVDKFSVDAHVYASKMYESLITSNTENFILEPIKSANMDSYKIFGMSLNEVVGMSGVDINSVVEKNINTAKNIVGQFDGEKGWSGFHDGIKEKLRSTYKYSDADISSLENVLYGKRGGYVSKYGMSAVLYDKEGALHVALGNRNDLYSNLEDISLGRELRKGASLPQVKINEVAPISGNADTVRLIENGELNKFNAVHMNTWVDNSTRGDSDWWKGINLRNKDTSSLVIEGQQIVHEQIGRLISEGNFRKAEEIAKRASSSVLIGESAAGLGEIMYENVKGLNPSDIVNATSRVAYSEMSTMIPALYNTDKEVQQYFDNTFGRKEMQKLFSDEGSITRIIKEKGVTNISDYDLKIQEWFVTNMFTPQLDIESKKSVLDRINDFMLNEVPSRTYGKDSIDPSRNALDFFRGKSFNQLNKDVAVAEGYAWSKNLFNYMPGVTHNELSRPLVRQTLTSHTFDASEITEANKERLRSMGISTDFDVTTKTFHEDYNLRYGEQYKAGYTANIQIMTTEQAQSKIFEVFGDIDGEPSEKLKQFASKHNYNLEEAQKMLKQYYSIATTNQQAGMINPGLKSIMMDKPELTSISINKNINITQSMLDDIVGSNMVLNEGEYIQRMIGDELVDIARYDKSIPGKVVGYREGSFVIEPLKGYVDQVKIGLQGVEKNVLSSVTSNTDMSQSFWDEIYGRHIGGIIDPELYKHQAMGSLNMSEINLMSRIAGQLDDTGIAKGQRALLESQMQQVMPYADAKFVPIKNNNMLSQALIFGGNMDDTGENLKNFTEATTMLKEKMMDEWFDTEGNFRYDLSTLDKIDKENMEFMIKAAKDRSDIKVFLMTRMQMVEAHSSLSDYDGLGKGVKVDNRMQQVAGALGSLKDGDITDFYSIGEEGAVKKYDVLFDELKKSIRSSDDYKSGAKDVRSLANTFRAASGSITTGNMAEVGLSELRPIIKGSYGPEDLDKTIYGFFGDADVLKINLEDGMKVKNPFTGKLESSAYISKTSPMFIGGELVNSEAQIKTSRFIDTLMSYAHNELPEGRHGTALDIVNQSYKEMHERILFDLSDHKKSLLSKSGLSGRVSHSGHMLATKIITPMYDKNGFLDKVHGKGLLEFDESGKLIKAKDATYLSREGFESMGVDFRKIGKQLEETNFFGDSSIIDIIGKADSQEDLGLRYVREIGIEGFDTRYPTFRDKSTNLTMFKLDDTSVGRVAVSTPYMGDPQKLDIDGDNKTVMLMLDRNNDGLLYDPNSGIGKQMRDLLEAQSKQNVNYLEAIRSDYLGFTDSIEGSRNLYDRTKMIEKLQSEGFDFTNALLNEEKVKAAIKSNQQKIAIGYISNANLRLRDVAESHFAGRGATVESVSKYTDLIKSLTNPTEQKLIDTKYLSSNMAVLSTTGGYSRAEDYASAIGSVFSSDVSVREEGIFKIKDMLESTGLIKQGDESWGGIESSLRELGSSEKARAHYFDASQKSSLGYKINDAANQIDEILEGNVIDSRRAQHHKDTLGEIVHSKKVRNKKGEYLFFENASNNIPEGVYEISSSGKSKRNGMFYANFKEVGSNKTYRHYEKNSTVMKEFLAGATKSIDDSGIDDAVNSVYNNMRNRTLETATRSSMDFESLLNDGMKGNYNDIQNSAVANAVSDLKSDGGQELFGFTKKVDTLAEKGYITEARRSSMIASMNEAIKEQGLNVDAVSQKSNTLLTESITEAVNSKRMPASKSVARYMAEDMAEIAKSGAVQRQAKTSSAQAISNLKSINMANVPEFKRQLNDIAALSYGNVSDSILKVRGDEVVRSTVFNRIAIEPMNQVNQFAMEDAQRAKSYMNEIIFNSDSEGMDFLNWKSAEETSALARAGNVDALGAQVVTYGDNVGKTFSQLSYDDLVSIRNVDLSSVGALDYSNLSELNSRIDSYFEAIDVSGKSAKVTRSNMNVTENVADYLLDRNYKINTDINDIILNNKKALSEVSSAERLASKGRQAVSESFGGAMKNLGDVKGLKTGALLVGGAIVAGSILKQHSALPGPLTPERRPNGGTPDAHGVYENPSGTKLHYKNGMDPKTVYNQMADEKLPQASKLKIRARAEEGTNPNDVAANINSQLGGNMSVNINDNRNSIDDNWISKQFSKLLR